MLKERRGQVMIQKLQSFVKQPIGRIEQQEDIQFIYNTSGELIGEIHMEYELLSRIDFYDIDALVEQGVPLTNSAMIDAMLRPSDVDVEVDSSEITNIANRIKESLDDRQLKLDAIVDFDKNYLAIFEEIEPRFGLTLPNTGLQLSIKRDGTLRSATFMREHYTVEYPETMISREEARDIILQEQLMQLTLDTQQNWNYIYSQKHDVYGVDVDGRVKKISEFPEMLGFCYDVLPEVTVHVPLEMLLLGGRQAEIEINEEEGERHWHVLIDEDPTEMLDEQPYIRACQALKLVVSEQYTHYEYERTPELSNLYNVAPFYLQELEQAYTTFRFVYRHHELYVSDKAVEITVHNKTSQIQKVSVPTIPYERLNNLLLPVISLEEANRIAKQHVDVTLSLERTNFERNIFKPMYIINYPNSPTGGNIESINAYTAEITYVDTGFVRVEE